MQIIRNPVKMLFLAYQTGALHILERFASTYIVRASFPKK